jgi:hypothetical protein
MWRVRSRALLALCLLPLLAGCGASSSDKSAAKTTTTQTVRIQGAPDNGQVEVVRQWADSLRRGDVDAATNLFALPSKVANGTPLLTLKTRRQVRVFNTALPCGAKVLTVTAHHGYLIAEFRLTDRTGPGAIKSCPGKGNKAATAFKIAKGHIVEWRRVLLPSEKGSTKPAPGSPT